MIETVALVLFGVCINGCLLYMYYEFWEESWTGLRFWRILALLPFSLAIIMFIVMMVLVLGLVVVGLWYTVAGSVRACFGKGEPNGRKGVS